MEDHDKMLLGGLAVAVVAGVGIVLVAKSQVKPSSGSVVVAPTSTGGSSTTAATTAPNAVSGLSFATTGPTGGTASWQASQAASSYVVQHTDASGSASSLPIIVNGATGSTFTVTGTQVTVGTLYTGGQSIAHITVTACNDVGCSAAAGPLAMTFAD